MPTVSMRRDHNMFRKWVNLSEDELDEKTKLSNSTSAQASPDLDLQHLMQALEQALPMRHHSSVMLFRYVLLGRVTDEIPMANVAWVLGRNEFQTCSLSKRRKRCRRGIFVAANPEV